MNKTVQVLLLSFLFIIHIECQVPQRKATVNETLDEYLNHLKERQGIPGISVAVIRNGIPIYKSSIGNANIEHDVPLSDKSIFRVYSLTKLMVATAIFHLIEKGDLLLEDPISKYVTDIPETWKEIQIKNLLTHSSGLPDMAPLIEFEDLSEEQAKEKIFLQQLKFSIGSKYEYNQTGFWLLGKIIEKLTDERLDSYLINNQFGYGLNKNEVFLSSDSREIISNRVTPYFPFRTGTIIIDHSYGRDYMWAKNGLNITLNRFIAWDKAFNANKLISQATKQKMWSTFNYKSDNKRFTYGWDQHQVNGEISYGFSGSLVTAYRNFPNKNLSIIVLSNGLEHYYNIENIVNHIAGLIDEDLVDINNEVFERLLQSVFDKGMANLEQEYIQLENNLQYKNINFELQINYVGYMLINLRKPELAIDVFTFNTKKYPNSWNTFDSLGEGFERNGDIKNAIANYKNAISLNPLNENENNTRLEQRITALSNGN